MLLCTSLKFPLRLHQIESKSPEYPKFSWGGMPPDPPRWRALRAVWSQNHMHGLITSILPLTPLVGGGGGGGFGGGWRAGGSDWIVDN